MERLIFCVAVSLLDQFPKIFVPVRHFDVKDLPFDFIGIVIGLVVIVVKGIIKAVSSKSIEEYSMRLKH